MEDLSGTREVVSDTMDTGNTDTSSSADGLTWRNNKPKPDQDVDFWKKWEKSGDIQVGESQDIQSGQDDNLPADQKPKPKPIDTRFKVLAVDLKKLFNRLKHKTLFYEHKCLIVRRGQVFSITVKLDKHFDPDEDNIRIQLVTGSRPKQSKGTMFFINPGKAIDVSKASAVIESVENKKDGTSVISVNVNLPSDSVIGRFTLCVWVQNLDQTNVLKKFTKYKVKDEMIVLFNPFAKEDLVYMEDAKDVKEYVMNQSGAVYVGSKRRVMGKYWNFGQFDSASLDAALYVLDDRNLPVEARGNPVRVARHLSAKVNSNDDDGVLVGNWSGNYTGGTSPTAWSGSVRILEEYLEKKAPVQYGQCWVFSAVTTTIGRALGLPTRSVTNFESAHDTDMSMTVDFHVDEEGEPMKHLNDSVWNFHVWNESWFRRVDLPVGYDGWQAYDATPQEMSQNMMQCGPAPVKAIKEGAVHIGYETPFIFSEVNGDRITWQVDIFDEYKVLAINSKSVGAMISTKAPGSRDRLDLTRDYKHKEGSVEERCVAKNVAQFSTRCCELEDYYKCYEVPSDVTMTLVGDINDNADINNTFTMVNTSSEERNVTVRLSVVATYYTGVDAETIKKSKIHIKLAPGQESDVTLNVLANEWLNQIDEDASVTVYALGRVDETLQTKMCRENLGLMKPTLDLQISEKELKVHKPFEVTISMTNPVNVALTNAYFMVEGAGIKTERKVVIGEPVAPGATVSRTIALTPKMPGDREIIASFHSRQLVGTSGTADINVKE